MSNTIIVGTPFTVTAILDKVNDDRGLYNKVDDFALAIDGGDVYFTRDPIDIIFALFLAGEEVGFHAHDGDAFLPPVSDTVVNGKVTVEGTNGLVKLKYTYPTSGSFKHCICYQDTNATPLDVLKTVRVKVVEDVNTATAIGKITAPEPVVP